MKRIGIIALAVILALSAAGCGCSNSSIRETTPSTAPATTTPATTAPATTAPTIMPDIPEIETNIPDPTVNENSTDDSTDMTGTTDTTATTDTTGTTSENSRSRNRYHGK